MHRTRLALLAVLAVLIVAVLPASAATNDWGTWTFTGHWTAWSGTEVDSHRIQGVVMGLKSLPVNNHVTSFTFGSHICKTSKSAGTGYCYYLSIPANKKLNWKVTTYKPLTSSDQLVPCIEWNSKFHCRYGNG